VSKTWAREPAGASIFERMTVTLPTDAICAVLGRGGSGRSTFLRLLSGAERPDRGEIISGIAFSVICNAGPYFHTALSGLDNIKLAARLHGMDAQMLTDAALRLADFADDWQVPAGALPGKARKPMEMLVAALLPYDCYLVDDVERVDPEIFAVVLRILRQRGAGMIFTAHNHKFAREFATFGCVIANRTAHAFESMEEALNHYA
jgi:capsular polysaccharide transport system ATP-binding protein